ncbi:MAG TPA: hypothetical protein VIV82_06325, partial [Verrucomicrobiae bacterium]
SDQPFPLGLSPEGRDSVPASASGEMGVQRAKPSGAGLGWRKAQLRACGKTPPRVHRKRSALTGFKRVVLIIRLKSPPAHWGEGFAGRTDDQNKRIALFAFLPA